MDRFQAMQVFQRIVEVNGFNKAAETLGLPASSVTQTIKSLEAYLGVRLLHRTTRRLKLTEDGERYYEHCKRILEDVENVEGSFPALQGNPRGRLRVDAPTSLGKTVLIPALKDFRERYPDIALTLTLTDRTADIVQEGIDCAIRTGAIADSSALVGRQVGSFSWITCASPEYLARAGEPSDVVSLRSHETIGYMLSRTGRPMAWHFEVDGEVTSFHPAGKLMVNDTESYIACGLEGLGIIRAGSFILQPHLESGRLRQVLPGYVSAPVAVSILYMHNRHQSPALRAFIAWVGTLFAVDPRFRASRARRKVPAAIKSTDA
ncbi:LysR family transcriptional regulator [Cupriavidus nantongensis]|uniref:LysR substrate-binding domain-containing protein n=1 Tax=Cupriavidus nantongensis TaxID=1796606 RepID=UPI002245EB95|nr:LysR family transcriptional regulator [Cupriavidus nantongensis]